MREIDITTPVDGRRVIADSYWCCVDGDPKRALFYGDSPQCNKNARIVESNAGRLFKPDENVKIVFVNVAYALQRH